MLYNQAGKAYNYRVTQQVWATPDQVQYILPQGQERLTLISCIGDKVMTKHGVDMTHRLVTIAEPEQYCCEQAPRSPVGDLSMRKLRIVY